MAMMYYGSTSTTNTYNSYTTSTYNSYRNQYIQDEAPIAHIDQGMSFLEVETLCKNLCNDYELPNKINQHDLIADVIEYFRADIQRSFQTAFIITLREYNKKLQIY